MLLYLVIYTLGGWFTQWQTAPWSSRCQWSSSIPNLSHPPAQPRVFLTTKPTSKIFSHVRNNDDCLSLHYNCTYCLGTVNIHAQNLNKNLIIEILASLNCDDTDHFTIIFQPLTPLFTPWNWLKKFLPQKAHMYSSHLLGPHFFFLPSFCMTSLPLYQPSNFRDSRFLLSLAIPVYWLPFGFFFFPLKKKRKNWYTLYQFQVYSMIRYWYTQWNDHHSNSRHCL